MPVEGARGYLEAWASFGITQHLGTVDATRKLAESCHLGSGQTVLDVGCGVGATPCYLAQAVGCQVVGVDLLHSMVAQAGERAEARGLAGRAEFYVADARKLPFADDLFDAVIIESVNVFFEDKQAAAREYVRVTKPGGYVGFTEVTWLQPPLPEEEAFYRQVFHADALEENGWVALMEEAGLQDVVGDVRPAVVALELAGQFERYGFWGIMRTAFRVVRAFLGNRSSRASLMAGAQGIAQGMLGSVGYGVYAGRKVD